MSIRRLLLAVLASFLCLLSLTANAKRAIIIDTDAAIDDLMAIAYLIQHPDMDVKGITIAATGESRCQPALHNIGTILKMAGKHIPLACGQEQPLQGQHRFPQGWSDFAETQAYSQPLLKTNTPLQTLTSPAISLLEDVLTKQRTATDIIALGPLTNLGSLLRLKPQLANKIRMIYSMGGAVHVPGNVEVGKQKAEWNFYIDPLAVQIVLQSTIPLTLIPLDVTNLAHLESSFYQKLQASTQPLIQYLNKLYQATLVYNQAHQEHWEWLVWDTLAAVISSDTTLSSCNAEKLKIHLAPEDIAGSLEVDNSQGRSVFVCQSLNQARFMQDLQTVFFKK